MQFKKWLEEFMKTPEWTSDSFHWDDMARSAYRAGLERAAEITDSQCAECSAAIRAEGEQDAPQKSLTAEHNEVPEEIWVTKEEDHIKVGDMDEVHVRNTLRMLIRQIRRGDLVRLGHHQRQLSAAALLELMESRVLETCA